LTCLLDLTNLAGLEPGSAHKGSSYGNLYFECRPRTVRRRDQRK